MKKIFYCSCDTHEVEISYDKPTKKFPYACVGIEIREICSKITGKPYKHKRWMADVMLLNQDQKRGRNDINKFIDFVGKFPKAIEGSK